MKIDVLVAEIGSTTTIVNAFHDVNTFSPQFLGQGQAATSVDQGDVNIGLKNAINNLKTNLKAQELQWDEFLATSSAAGGLRMSVHGLVYDMTVRAAKEAALGAGAIIKYVTAGKLHKCDLDKVKKIRPNIILVAGGVDYGERNTAIHNFNLLSKELPNTPMIYAGNVQNQDEIKEVAREVEVAVYITENVFPAVDILNVEPTRKIIQDAFEKHIIHAPGMENIRELVDGAIMPTPGAVMESTQLLYELLGDVVVFDVGGATTDLHSVTEGSEEIKRLLISPEPLAKRTVEGDLGVYINIPNIVEKVGLDTLEKQFPNTAELIKEMPPIPTTAEQIEFVERLTLEAVLTALGRHAGTLKNVYGPSGKKTVAIGKDLSAVKHIIGTGGALTRLPGRHDILKKTILGSNYENLYPQIGASVLIDNLYLMASLGVLSKRYKEAAVNLLKQSLDIR